MLPSYLTDVFMRDWHSCLVRNLEVVTSVTNKQNKPTYAQTEFKANNKSKKRDHYK